MRNLLTMLGIVFLASCETSDNCHCEVFENIGTEEKPQLRYLGSLDGDCDSQKKEEKYVYQSVSCD